VSQSAGEPVSSSPKNKPAVPARLVLATRNTGKKREFEHLLAGVGIVLEDLTRHPSVPDLEESGDSYLANARLKAAQVARHTGLPSLADDSGLEVDALGGEPGIHSARFAGPLRSDRENVALLLARLRGVEEERRTARFRCVLVLAKPDGAYTAAEGACEGFITLAPRGEGGFGYDPVFFYPPAGRTFAELGEAEKNRVSHRARACERLRKDLAAFLGEPVCG
jgi:XTP/dITP diphosphohydrolase